jgi:hypothetical protein
VCLPVQFPDLVKSFLQTAAASYWGKMPRNKRSNGFAVGNSIEEEVKMAVGMSVRDFMNDHSRMELSFPSSLTREQRAYVHQLVSGKFALNSIEFSLRILLLRTRLQPSSTMLSSGS